MKKAPTKKESGHRSTRAQGPVNEEADPLSANVCQTSFEISKQTHFRCVCKYVAAASGPTLFAIFRKRLWQRRKLGRRLHLPPAEPLGPECLARPAASVTRRLNARSACQPYLALKMFAAGDVSSGSAIGQTLRFAFSAVRGQFVTPTAVILEEAPINGQPIRLGSPLTRPPSGAKTLMAGKVVVATLLPFSGKSFARSRAQNGPPNGLACRVWPAVPRPHN
jgi:hypothetical protein